MGLASRPIPVADAFRRKGNRIARMTDRRGHDGSDIRQKYAMPAYIIATNAKPSQDHAETVGSKGKLG
jgi:hypothetical protein